MYSSGNCWHVLCIIVIKEKFSDVGYCLFIWYLSILPFTVIVPFMWWHSCSLVSAHSHLYSWCIQHVLQQVLQSKQTYRLFVPVTYHPRRSKREIRLVRVSPLEQMPFSNISFEFVYIVDCAWHHCSRTASLTNSTASPFPHCHCTTVFPLMLRRLMLLFYPTHLH